MVEKGTQLRTTRYVAVCYPRAKDATAAQHPIAEQIGRMPLYANVVVTRPPPPNASCRERLGTPKCETV